MISNLEICGLNLELRQTVTGLTIVLRVERGEKKLESLKMTVTSRRLQVVGGC